MGLFHEIRNPALIRELERELNTDVLLFGVDGFTYFGNLQAIEECRIAILTPAIEAATPEVEILTPGGEVRDVSFLRLDLWSIIGKGTGIVKDPFLNSVTSVTIPRDSQERLQSKELICRLERMIGDNVAITTLGGFLFQGILGAVDDCLAVLTVDKIFVPGSNDAICEHDIRSVVVNLEGLTSVATVSCC
ncbi:hypothetical protein P22_0300 [Propionispora sp. 2/2-37]|uniref:hypothetical protein n=1 Tax=Propionispora sp. 2/2-37 TaxID=1677858 RepID=UPI0006BB8FF2|nr:hypothetical protein [Propionispora sp. 2/2-37]CUH94234.1 hypothetical protein P22_0300 [Propionispora sp. 2/2-37]